ncbi:MAG: PKD domain-containing protein [Bacteroidetes bacterium]|nr:MAG: PKD domain-containing protein [Bacteroidota bacterium]
MRKIYTTVAALLLIATAADLKAQLTVSGAMTPSQLVTNVLLGTGVTVSNITYTGAAAALGSFTANSTNLGITSGVLMTCGDIANAPGPNNQTGASVSNNLNGDPDLDAIMSPTLSYDASILEFDFTTTGDSIVFRYVFASEEFMEYVSQTPGGINDGFGFFLSGPGITGPFTNNAENIALIPNTSLPVTMFNVNCTSPNSAYYVCNDPVNTICSSSFNCPGSQAQTTIQYDGMTVVLTARHAVQCNQTYHIKLAVGDGADHILDSGVFLEEGSFSATNVDVSSETNYGGSNDSTLWEGCGQACLYFTRDGNFGQYDTLSLALVGSATNGIDFFPPFPAQIVFVPGQDTITLCVSAPNDGLSEVLENLTITATSAGICVQSVSQATIYFSDYNTLDVDAGNDTAMCTSNPVILSASAIDGTEPYTYLWSTGSTTPTTTVTPTQTTSYTVTVTDACGYVTFDTVNVFIPTTNPLTVNAGSDMEICPSDNPVTLSAFASGGANGYTYQWTTLSGPDQISSNQPTVIYTATGNTTISLQVTDACGNTTTDQVIVGIHECELIFPNVFTPNGDPNNEYFVIQGIEYFPNSVLTVFNRWGGIVFQEGHYQNTWSPKDVSDGTYYYVLDASDGRSYSGFVTIIR